MPQNVVINFESNIDGLKPAIDALQKIGKVTEEDVKEFNKANAAQKELATSATKGASSYDKLADSAANAQKNIVSGATNKAIEGTNKLVQQQVGLIAQLEQRNKDLVAARNRSTNEVAIQRYNQLIEQNKQKLTELTTAEKKAGTDTHNLGAKFEDIYGELQPLNSRIGELEDRLYEMALAGQKGTDEFKAIQEEVVRFKQIIQNTDLEVDALTEHLGFEGAVQGIATIAAGFEVVTGAENLFGVSTEELQERLVKLQSVMALVNGLQTIQTNLMGRSTLATQLAAAKTYVLTGAQAAYTVVVGASTGAMKALRIALAATGIGAIIIALVALIQNFGAVKDAVVKFIDQFEFVKKGIEVLVKAFNWLKEELGFGDKLSDELKKLEEFNKAVIDSYNKQQARILALRKSQGQNTLDFEKRSNDLLIKEQQKLFDIQRKALIEQAKETGKIDEDAKKKFIEDVNAFYDTTNQLQARNNDIEYEIMQRGLQARKNLIDARLQYVQKGSEAELKLKLNQIAAELAIDNSQRDKVAGQVALNEAKANVARKQAFEDFKAFQIQGSIDTENKKLTIVQAGSLEELNIRRNLLNLENELTVNNSKLSQNQKELKLAENAQKEIELIKRYGQAQITLAEQIEAKKQTVGNNRLQKYQEDLNAEYQYYNDIADLEFQSSDQTYNRIENLRREKFARNIGLLDAELAKVQQTNENIVASEEKLQRDLADKANADPANRGQYELAILQSQDRVVTAEQKTADEIVRINREKNKQIISNDNEAEANRRANLLKQVDLVQSISDQSVAILKQASDIELQDKMQAYDAESAANQKNLDDKIISQRQYEVNEKEIEKRRNIAKKQAFEQEKNIQIAQTLINTAAAVVKALNTQPYPVGVAFAALAAAAGAVQLAAISRTKYPGFAKGTNFAPKGWAWVGENGPELVNLRGGEQIKTAEQSKNFAQVQFEKEYFNNNTLAGAVDASPVLSKKGKEATTLFQSEPSFALDYHLLSGMISQGVGQQIGRMPITQFTFDKNGFAVAVANGSNTTRYMDNRYSTN